MKTHAAYLIVFALAMIASSSCRKDPDMTEPPASEVALYFPPVGSSDWAVQSPESLGWRTDKIPELLQFLEDGNTRAFIVLKGGKIVIEQYFGKDLLGLANFGPNTNWYWASAGKTLTAFTVGLAQEEGHLDIDAPSADYLGSGWAAVTPQQEKAITVRHHLTMTTGLDDQVADSDCTKPECLVFRAAPGTRWAYHNAPYTILDRVVEGATGRSFEDYFQDRLAARIGMDGFWTYLDYNHVYFSTARTMARFGLLTLNGGRWEDTPIISDEQYFEQMVNTSQDLNPSYGYLWWLNGKAAYRLPGLQIRFNGSPAPAAPADMISGLGKNGQFVNVVPGKQLVVVRMGDNPDNALVPVVFLNEMWEKLNAVIR